MIVFVKIIILLTFDGCEHLRNRPKLVMTLRTDYTFLQHLETSAVFCRRAALSLFKRFKIGNLEGDRCFRENWGSYAGTEQDSAVFQNYRLFCGKVIYVQYYSNVWDGKNVSLSGKTFYKFGRSY